MRDSYRGYYRPNDEEIQSLWETGLVVFDANALLNLYRYSPDTVKQFSNILTVFKDQLWLPHQAGLEFQRNRFKVITGQSDAFTKIQTGIEKAKNSISEVIRQNKKHSWIQPDDLIDSVEAALAPLLQKLKDQQEAHSESSPDNPMEDPVWSFVTTIYEGRVGDAFASVELEEIYAEGRIRYEQKIPPGYEDKKNKPEPEMYGDLVIWKEILRKAKREQKPVIFVTDDGKEDWWRKEHGKVFGPRVELVEEFIEQTGQLAHLYSPEQFISLANNRRALGVSDFAIGEVREVSEHALDTDVLRQLIARKKDLEHRRDTTVESLARIENGVMRREQLGILGADLQALQYERYELQAEFDLAGVRIQKLSEHRALMADLDVTDPDVTAEMRFLQRNVADLEMRKEEATRNESALERRIAKLSSGTFSSPERQLNLRHRLHSADAELEEVNSLLERIDILDNDYFEV